MRGLWKGLAAAGLVAVAGLSAFAYGYEGSLDNVHSALSEAVSGGDASAIKMNAWVEKPSTALSKDFITFSKVVKEAEKGDFSVLSEEFLESHFSNMIEQSAFEGVAAFQHLVNVAGSNPLKAAKILKANAKYLVNEGKFLSKYENFWGELADPSKRNLAKAAVAWAHVQKLYEIIDKVASKYDG